MTVFLNHGDFWDFHGLGWAVDDIGGYIAASLS